MERFSPGQDAERALFGVGCAYLLLSACVVLWRCGRSARSASPGGLAQGLLQWLAVPLRRARRDLRPDADHEGVDIVARQAAEELQRRKLTQCKLLLPYGQFGSMFSATAVWFGGTLPTTFAQDCSSLAVCMVITVLWVAPSTITRGTVDWIYSAVMAGLSVTMWPLSVSADTVLNFAMGTWICALAVSFGHLKPWLNAIWIFIINATACITILAGVRSGDTCASPQPLREAMQLSAISFVSVLVLVAVDRLLQQVTRLELEAHLSRNELAAAQSVLRSVCDAVVEVDDALRLREDSPELRDLLFLNQHRSLRQEDVRGFLASAEDAAKFHAQVRDATATGPHGGGQLSAAFHVFMKDSAGITLEVEVFVVRFVNREGQQAYLVGIREQSDSDPASELRGPRRGGFPRAPRRPCARAPPLDLGGPPWGSAAARGLGRSPSSSSAASSCSSAGSLHDAKMSVWVDLLSDAWTIVSVTDTLQMCMGLAEDELDFLPLVRSDQRERLIVFVQEAHFHGPDRVAPVSFGEPVFFRTAHMRRLNLCLSAPLEVDWCPAAGSTPPAAEVPRISLGEISWFNGGWRGRSAPRGAPRTPRHSPRLCSL